MNQLSWLLYWANVCGNVGPLFVISAVILISVIGIRWITVLVDSGGYYRSGDDNAASRKSAKRFSFWLTPFIFILLLLSAFVPSADTMYAIAASQAGEQLLKTPTATIAEQALNAWLQRQIMPPPKESN